MVTFENVVFEAKFKKAFISWKSPCSVLEIFNFLHNHSINFENCDIMMSISTQSRVHF